MPPIINARDLSKRFGERPLFDRLSITVSEGDRIGLIGPNGSGKSTLLGILARQIEADTGEISTSRLARVADVPQESSFRAGRSVRAILIDVLTAAGVPETEHPARIGETMGKAGFTDLDIEASTLSGGWTKRLAIASALATRPDVLLLDEPTNHLDLDGIRWLETAVGTGRFASVIVSHDRYLLENVVTSVVELNPLYEGGLLRVEGRYSDFLEAREAYLVAEGKRAASLSNRVRNEIAWLRRGPKARSTKARARIDHARELIGELADLHSRQQTGRAEIDFSATERQTKRLIELDDIGFSVDGRKLFGGIDLAIGGGTRLGVVGPNGSGKTTFLRLIRGEVEPDAGRIRRADRLRIVYFDQKRNLDPDITLRRALAPDGDSVIYQDRMLHVATWAARFLFSGDDLNQPVGRLSGGERARVRIAQLMLEPADVLLLDEPTNDLDIPTLEILEESLIEFRGALVLVTHDRHMMDRVTTGVLGLDGRGGAGVFADYVQWERWCASRVVRREGNAPARKPPVDGGKSKRKLTYVEAREFGGIEERIEAAEAKRDSLKAIVGQPEVATDSERLVALAAELDGVEVEIDRLYSRWEELQRKQAT